jgi:hypothetical protein
MDEDNGVLGNLPRSRPGTRSQKRDAPAPAARSQPPRQARSRPKPPPAPAPQAGDPVGDAVRGAARAAGAGLKLANGVTREFLRRLPKP